jgi:hypothetical protein
MKNEVAGWELHDCAALRALARYRSMTSLVCLDYYTPADMHQPFKHHVCVDSDSFPLGA